MNTDTFVEKLKGKWKLQIMQKWGDDHFVLLLDDLEDIWPAESDFTEYSVRLMFYDVERQPQVDDYLFISKEFFDPDYIEYSDLYWFGALDSPAGRDVSLSRNINDLIAIRYAPGAGGKTVYLKRLFG